MQIKKTLKRLGSQSGAIGERFLEETDHRVLRPEELPYAEISAPEKDQRLLTTTTEGIVMDCPTGIMSLPKSLPVCLLSLPRSFFDVQINMLSLHACTHSVFLLRPHTL